MLDLPLADPHAVLAANRQRLGLNARNIYALASPVCSLHFLFGVALLQQHYDQQHEKQMRTF